MTVRLLDANRTEGETDGRRNFGMDEAAVGLDAVDKLSLANEARH